MRKRLPPGGAWGRPMRVRWPGDPVAPLAVAADRSAQRKRPVTATMRILRTATPGPEAPTG